MQERVSGSLEEFSRRSVNPIFGRIRQASESPAPSAAGQPKLLAVQTESRRDHCGKLYRYLLGAVLSFSGIVANLSAHAADPNNILLDFSASWCGPCQQMSPIVSKLERQGFPIRKVDIDVEKALTRQFKVESIPCFVLVANGKEINRITGATDEKELRRLLMMLPKQNIDDAVIGKNSRNSGTGVPTPNPGAKTPDDKKSFLRIPPLFAKNQEKQQDLVLTPTNPSDTFRGQNPGQTTPDESFSRDPLVASARIRVKDGSRLHFGSGTIIDSQPGRSVILTCGHIFRDLGNDAIVEVDLFTSGGSKPQMIVGQILRYDLKADIGLVTIPSKQRLPTIRLGSTQNAPNVRDRVVSVGCGGGERPTREEHSVTAINKYLGPDNLECNGVPQQGRSGGGLFLGSELVGVCIAADPRDKRGIYTGVKPVAQLLHKAQLGHLAPAIATVDDSLVEADDHSEASSLGNALELTEESPRRADDEIARVLESATRGSGNSTAAVSDYVGAEIVCIVRPKTPGAMSRVVIVNQATTRFVDDLLHESSGGGRTDSAAAAQSTSGKTSKELRSTSHASSSGTRMAMQKPTISQLTSAQSDRTFETSFEPERYRRKRN